MRKKYWSNSKFANFIRGRKKPYAETFEGWRLWEETLKKESPIRAWLAEDALDGIQRTVMWPIDKLYDVKYYINNRWVTKTHCLTSHPSDIKRGSWKDVGDRFLPCLFNELVDFVEIELAWSQIAWNPEERKKYKTPFWAYGWFRWRAWRCPEAGLDNLEWQSQLRWTANEVGTDSEMLGQYTHQAISAQEILHLYKWWKEVYPNRPDPYDESRWNEYCGIKSSRGSSFSTECDPDLIPLRDESLKKLDEMEREYRDEDEEMLTRLIRIRGSLWT